MHPRGEPILLVMRILIFSTCLLGLFISSCTNEISNTPSSPSEWVVIGNDLGSRNEFIDMANVVRLTDSNLTVFSVAYPDVALDFPILDSTVIGSTDKQWQLTLSGTDTLILHDTLQGNRYHLLRLKDYAPETDLWKMLTESRFASRYYGDQKTLIFEGSDKSEANCYVAHLRRTRDEQSRLVRLKDGFWRLDQRFSQPLLLYTLGQGDHYVTLIDTIGVVSGLQGQLIINSRPNPLLNRRDTLRPITDTVDMVALRDKIADLDFGAAKVKPMIDPATDSRWRVSWNGAELKDALSVNDFEVNDLRLDLSSDYYSLSTLGEELTSGKYMLHPRYPYLMLEGNCANDFYLPISVTATNELEILLPIRIRLPNQKIRPSRFGGEAPDRVAYSENAVVFTIPLEADMASK